MAISRIGKRPVAIPKGVSVVHRDGRLTVKGPGGELVQHVPDGVHVTLENGQAAFSADEALGRGQKACHGLVRALLANMVKGVTEGYEKRLQILGVGYTFTLNGDTVGFSKAVFSFDRPFKLPAKVKGELTDKNTVLVLKSPDKDLLGRTATDIRALVPPNRYKEKGVRFVGERVVLKQRKGAK